MQERTPRSLAPTAADRAQRPAGPDSCLHRIFERQAHHNPNAVAITSDTERLTYGQLNRQANRLSHHLAAMGVGAESRVLLCMDRSPQMVVGILASLKAGGCYVPLDPTYPFERLAFMLKDAGGRVLVGPESLTEGLIGDGVEVEHVAPEGKAVAKCDDGDLCASVQPDNLVGCPQCLHQLL